MAKHRIPKKEKIEYNADNLLFEFRFLNADQDMILLLTYTPPWVTLTGVKEQVMTTGFHQVTVYLLDAAVPKQ